MAQWCRASFHMWEIVGALGGRRACALRGVRRRLGCILSAQSSHSLDVNFEIQAACKAFYANVGVLCDKKVSLQHLLQCFNAVVSPVACCAAIHRKIFIAKLDITFRRWLRSVAGSCGDVDWTQHGAAMARDFNMFGTSGFGNRVFIVTSTRGPGDA